jgi:uncharacterized protein YgiM (DUF1202 family)
MFSGEGNIMKKVAAFLGVLLCVFTMATSAWAADYTVARDMNFRAAPALTGQRIGSVPKGAKVSKIGESNGWDQVSYNGVTGWIHGGNLMTAEQAAAAAAFQAGAAQTAAGVTKTAVVNYSMNFRAAPNMSGQILSTVPAGSTVPYIGSSNGWDQIIFNGVQGWIAGGRITIQNSAASAAGTAAAAAPAAASTVGATLKNSMNFRSAPALTGSVLSVIPSGTVVQYVSSANGWDNIVYQGTSGWIKSGNFR